MKNIGLAIKKTTSFILIIAILFTICQLSVSASGIKYGDLNSDGKIDESDLECMRQCVVGTPVSINLEAADLNGDGQVNISDLVIIRQYLSGAITQFPVETKAPHKQTKKSYSLPIKQYFQNSGGTWKDQYICGYKFSSIGCAATCVAMLKSYRLGRDFTPTDVINTPGQFNGDADIYWSVAGVFVSRLSDYCKAIYEQINKGNPVIIQWDHYWNGGPHYVIAYGYKDVTIDANGNPNVNYENILIRDPNYNRNWKTLDQFKSTYGIDGILY